MKEQPDATTKINFLDRQARNCGARLYLIIDEYDNFTNVVLKNNGNKAYHSLTHASTLATVMYSRCFEGMFDHIFMTSVSPVALDDLTTGFNNS